MMSTQGLGRARRFPIGSVTTKVLHDATCAVWTSRHPAELESFRPYRHILLAMDHQGWPTDLLTRAAEIAGFFRAQLSVVSALPADGLAGDEVVQKRYRDMAKDLEQRIASTNINACVHLREGRPGDVVAQVAEEIENADLIVTGRGHLDKPMGQMLTHAYEIIRNAPCPVVTL
jgi:nucleotide-binding universal stress UspA family protein